MTTSYPGQSGPNIVEVARVAGVSRQTVSNALNAPERLRPATLEHVQKVIDELGYRPSQAARALRTRAARQIGYRVDPERPHSASALQDQFLHALAEAAQADGYFLLLFTPRDTADELATYGELIRTGSVDGFVLSGIDPGDERPERLLGMKAPFVSFGRVDGGDGPQLWVDVDGASGTGAAVDHLVSQGHRRIAFLGMPDRSSPGRERARGWREALARQRLQPGGLACAEDTVAAGTRAASALLDLVPRPTAVVAATDTLALGCYAAARERGLRIGHELAVIGFDDSPTAELVDPPLTSLRQPLPLIGQELMRRLTGRLSGRDQVPSGLLLEPRLIVRASSVPFGRQPV
ncbi:LacI family DNA-binding transcriptional regulator [Amycolatopsis sp. H20-H5]|uniref:LacI family DNA-binding transcriptional regulator n=1 Tax=Amycolatopsis sp. H20-H5 TaxID=3046309 RepID=UPI002DC02F75|nr:LacI family transcriptional regulator [Amycolatopsis sp. H20-H5]MEC3979196.1 LacI family transcriptional regulator [Amycolatopsis sp. H20-H5]